MLRIMIGVSDDVVLLLLFLSWISCCACRLAGRGCSRHLHRVCQRDYELLNGIDCDREE